MFVTVKYWYGQILMFATVKYWYGQILLPGAIQYWQEQMLVPHVIIVKFDVYIGIMDREQCKVRIQLYIHSKHMVKLDIREVTANYSAETEQMRSLSTADHAKLYNT